jgi:hypothetical protein
MHVHVPRYSLFKPRIFGLVGLDSGRYRRCVLCFRQLISLVKNLLWKTYFYRGFICLCWVYVEFTRRVGLLEMIRNSVVCAEMS